MAIAASCSRGGIGADGPSYCSMLSCFSEVMVMVMMVVLGRRLISFGFWERKRVKGERDG